MPNTHETLTGLFSDIADAIRAKTGETGTIIADQFPEAIEDIQTGGVATRLVTIQDSPFDNLYYTDANMEPVEVHRMNTDVSNAPLPVGSILVLARHGTPPPMEFPMTVSGLELLDTYTVGTKGEVRIYQVQEASS